ncbi:MAG: polysaccharide biosynthesis protein [Gammaproteobacteria bacterium]|nr:polysaccharide biosynthesis protein [Gammaproteobacteria bacterium]
MSVQKNTVVNYVGRVYASLIGILILPFYFHYLGAAAFGLVSLFTVMQALLQILDMGLAPTLAREVAHHRHQPDCGEYLHTLLHSLEVIFLGITVAILAGIILMSPWIAHHWLKVEGLSYSEVIMCISIMGGMITFRWFSDLYRSGVLAWEHQVWFNVANISMMTLQYLGGYALLRWVTHRPLYFFEYQLMVAGLDALVFGGYFYRLLPSSSSAFHVSFKAVKRVLPFAGGLIYTFALWVILTQVDKIVLSHLLPLSTYGYFALVVAITGGITQLSGPLTQAILPRMTALLSQHRESEMLNLYRAATQTMMLLVFPIAGVIAVFGSTVIQVWTKNPEAAAWGGPILFWYALGSAVSSVLGFPYYLQYAHGNLKIHVVFNTFAALIAIPAVILAALYGGALGTGMAWFLIQILSFITLPFIVHRCFAPSLQFKWFSQDILPILSILILTLLCLKMLHFDFNLLSRSQAFIVLAAFTVGVFIMSILASSVGRDFLKKKVLKMWGSHGER